MFQSNLKVFENFTSERLTKIFLKLLHIYVMAVNLISFLIRKTLGKTCVKKTLKKREFYKT